jgi:hypothetical protein
MTDDSELRHEFIKEMEKIGKEKPSHIDDIDDLFELDKEIAKYEEYVKEHPERLGVKGNIKTLKHVRKVLGENNEK